MVAEAATAVFQFLFRLNEKLSFAADQNLHNRYFPARRIIVEVNFAAGVFFPEIIDVFSVAFTPKIGIDLTVSQPTL